MPWGLWSCWSTAAVPAAVEAFIPELFESSILRTGADCRELLLPAGISVAISNLELRHQPL
jgi:hypothetical protein